MSLQSLSEVVVIDCAIQIPALDCFNQLVTTFNRPMTYHWPSKFEMASLPKDTKKRIYIVLGSYSNVSEPLDWHAPLCQFLIKQLEASNPVLGICFSHQLLAYSFGAKVKPVHKSGELIEGPVQITFDSSFGDIKSGTKMPILFSHKYHVVDLPKEFKTIAHSDLVPHQIIQHGKLPFWGVQGHPEASLGFLRNTLTREISHEEFSDSLKNGMMIIKSFFQEAQNVGNNL